MSNTNQPLNRNNGSADAASPQASTDNPTQYQPESHTGGIAARNRIRVRREFLRTFPHAKYCHDPNCQRDHEQRDNLDLQLNHFKCWSVARRILLEKVYRKVNNVLASDEPGYWNNQRKWKNYDQTASLIALSAYPDRTAFCNCGFYSYSCADRLLCLRCCFNLLASPALREFRRALDKDTECYFIVLSLSSDPGETNRLIFKDLTKSEMEQIKLSGQTEQNHLDDYGIPFRGPMPEVECQTYFRIFREAIHDFTGRGKLFSGAFGGPELAVRFLPLAVLPHANYIAWSPGLCGDDLRRFRRAIREKMRGCRTILSGQYPKLSVYRIQDNKDYRAVIKYIFKPIDVGFAYGVAADAASENEEHLIPLNRETDNFLEDLPMIFSGIHRMNRFGFCSTSSENYVGMVTPERQERREKDAVRRLRKQKEVAVIRKILPGYQPYKRKRTKQEREDLFEMRLWYKKSCLDGEKPTKPFKRWLQTHRRTAVK
jgi:hypothetical protein